MKFLEKTDELLLPIMNKSDFMSVSVTLISSILSWVIFYIIFSLLVTHRASAFLASFFVATTIAHEIGHVLVMRYHGLKTHAYMGIIAGRATGNEDDKFNNFPFNKKAQIYMSGMVGNIAVAILFAVLYAFGVATTIEMIFVLLLTGLLIIRNLIAHSITDGHRLISLIIMSDNNNDNSLKKIGALSFGVFIITAIVLVLNGRFLFFLCASLAMIFIIFSLWDTSFRIHKSKSPNTVLLTEDQKIFWGRIYAGLIGVSMIMLTAGAFLEDGSLLNALMKFI